MTPENRKMTDNLPKLVPDKEPASPQMYGGNGLLYNYNLFTKTKESIRAYFELPLVRSFFNELVGSTRQVSVLDLGSGIGAESGVIKTSFPNIQGISLELNTYGSQKGKAEYDTNQLQANALDLPFADLSFDAIHSKDMFIHINNKKRFFSEASRVLNDGGLLLIVTSGSVYENFGQIGWNEVEIEEIALQCGLTLEQTAVARPATDDWYITNPERHQLLFRKV